MVVVQASMIDILIPVLGRPQNAHPLIDNIEATTEMPFHILFICTPGDEKQINACCSRDYWMMSDQAGPGDYAKKINTGFRHTFGEWIFQAADDLVFQPGWDTAALKAAGDRFDVVATNDLANSSVKRGLFGTHNLIRRRYVTDPFPNANVLWEGYDHNFVDRELCGHAQCDGVYTFARHAHVKHNHPLWKTAPSDPTYIKSLAGFHQDQKLFYSRAHLWDYHGLSAHERRMAA